MCKSYYNPKDGEHRKDKHNKLIKNPATFIQKLINGGNFKNGEL